MISFDVKGKRVLLLQGPMGPFFRRLADGLTHAGAELVHKVNFNGGDRFFFPGGFDFTGSLDEFGSFLGSLLEAHRYDMVCLFGDCRPHHVKARRVCADRQVVVMVFEEGYLRPHFITVEPGGVNGNSMMPRDPQAYFGFGDGSTHSAAATAHFRTKAWVWGQSFCYGLFMALNRKRYPEYKHHRKLDLREGVRWLTWESEKVLRRRNDGKTISSFLAAGGKRFFVPLQVASDCQVVHHSPYGSLRGFIAEVIRAFAAHAASDAVLLFKHHPLDPYDTYASHIAQEVKRWGVKGRVLYCVNGHLPTILSKCSGVVTINSTVGFSALLHRRPLCIRGTAIYDLDQLVTRDLDDFMRAPETFAPNPRLVEGFRNYLLATNQAAGNFHRVLFKGTKTGLLWPKETNFEKQLGKRRSSERIAVNVPQSDGTF